MSENGWALEVIRGRESGRVYPLARGEVVLGNALNGGPGLDLATHEGDGPRKMAPRQAQLDSSEQALLVRDLGSPGGTFVNRQRLLAGQARALQDGDVIQLGGVQLKVVAGRAASPPAPPPAAKATPPAPPPSGPTASPPVAGLASQRSGSLPAPFVLASGPTCRTWDDFLTVSAQRWAAMCDELSSGRLAAFLTSIRRTSMVPASNAQGTPDERLDAWLATLPTSRPSRPELDVHPEKVLVRVVPGGGLTRQSVRITNTGYRLLRSTVRVERDAESWIKVPQEFTGAPFLTVEETVLPFEIQVPETIESACTGGIVIEGNGGTRRVEVRLERPRAPEELLDIGPPPPGTTGDELLSRIERQPLALRIASCAAGACLIRILVALGGLVPGVRTAEVPAPSLLGAAIVFALVGSLTALRLALKHGEHRDLPAAAFAGGFAGVLAACMVVAACRAIETGWASHVAVQLILWSLLGAGISALSAFLVPPTPGKDGAA